jgi:hypothetical protein
MRLSPGDAVKLVNISASGVLVEGKTRFVPGTRVTVIFEGPAAPPSVKARVIRCQVSAIGGGGSLQYHSAIAFEAKIELPVDEAALPPVLEGGRGSLAGPTRQSLVTESTGDNPQLVVFLGLSPVQSVTRQPRQEISRGRPRRTRPIAARSRRLCETR